MGLTLALIAFALPVLAGFAIARLRPAMPAPFVAMLSAAPLLGAYGLFIAYLLSGGVSAPFGIAAAAVFGTMVLLCGFGLGMVGHLLGNRR